MLHIVEVTFPFFALVGIGWGATRLGWMPVDAVPGLNRFVLYFALPCMLFRFTAATPVARLFDPVVFGVWLLVGLALVAAVLLLTRHGSTGWNDGAFGALVAAFPNSGFMGVPLLVGLLGSAAAAPAIVALAVDMVVTSSLCIAVSRLGDRAASGAPPATHCAVCQALRGMAVNPLPWSIALGAACSLAGWAPPSLLMKPVALLADAASPVALFTLGVMLARASIDLRARVPGASSPAGAGSAHPVQQRRGDIALLVAFKLLVHPAAVALACWGAVQAGLALDPLAATTLVLTAALPSASNVPMVAERYGADAGRLARVVLWSTVGSFATFTAWVAVVR